MKTAELQRAREIKYANTLAHSIFSLARENNSIQLVNHVRNVQPHGLSYLNSLPAMEDEWQGAIRILEQYNYKPKLFCDPKADNINSEFEVISRSWNWIVRPVKNSDYIPARFLEAVRILFESSFNIDGIAIAKPKPKEVASGVIKQELHYQIKMLLQVLLFVFSLIAQLTKNTLTAITTTQNIAPASYVDPDPVLLVRIQGKWIEIGRWI